MNLKNKTNLLVVPNNDYNRKIIEFTSKILNNKLI